MEYGMIQETMGFTYANQSRTISHIFHARFAAFKSFQESMLPSLKAAVLFISTIL